MTIESIRYFSVNDILRHPINRVSNKKVIGLVQAFTPQRNLEAELVENMNLVIRINEYCKNCFSEFEKLISENTLWSDIFNSYLISNQIRLFLVQSHINDGNKIPLDFDMPFVEFYYKNYLIGSEFMSLEPCDLYIFINNNIQRYV